jgi:predicted alpha-1,2-mannosidase
VAWGLVLAGLVLLGAPGHATGRDAAPTARVRLVDPFIGTGGHGHTFPGPTAPFGMVQLGPDTRLSGWDGCSAYHHGDAYVYGFSHTHLSGTGCSDYGDVLFVPGAKRIPWANGADGKTPGYRQRYHDEEAHAGSYGVTLGDGTRVRLTTTPRVGIHEYTWPQGGGHLLIDLRHRDALLDSDLEFVGDTEIRGFRRSRAWSGDQRVYFVARFSKPFRGESSKGPGDAAVKLRRDGKVVAGAVSFDTRPGEPLVVTVGLSAVDLDGAARNLEAEAPDFDFDRYLAAAEAAWEKQLAKIDVEGGTRAQRRTFYTALYHTAMAPNLFSDVDGRYRGTDLKIHQAEGWTQYTVFSLWDTFRAEHPLFTITERARTRDFLRTFLAQFRDGGSLPIWELAGWYTGCMIGYHAIPVIADAWAKGIRDFDTEKMLQAMLHSATKDGRGLPSYRRNGYVRADDAGQSVSCTLEYAYDDWCIARMAKAWGHPDVAATYFQRAQSWKNVFDPRTHFMRPKRDGRFLEPFDPSEVNQHYTEANSFQYSLFVPQDLDGLTRALGGADALDAWLDRLFTWSSKTSGRNQADISGMIGQYAHGNEPSHNLAYLYVFAGRPWKTQERVRQILDTLYGDGPDGYCGNEDCGQMSAWYVLSALGFYPVTPGTTQYVIGTPLFEKATIHLENGKSFTIRAPGASSTNRYVQSATLDGAPHPRPVLEHARILAGGELVLRMGPKPSTWGSAEAVRPHTSIEAPPIVPVPFVAAGEPTFRDTTMVVLGRLDPRDELFVSTDGGATFARYKQPLVLQRSTTLRAYAQRDGVRSHVMESVFRQRKHDWTVSLSHPYAPQYPASGPQALLDGVEGGTEWVAGGWQGFEGQDLVATVDLKRPTEVRAVHANFLQDERSWIWPPTEVVVEASEDGKAWHRLGRVTHDVDPKAQAVTITTLGLETSVTARYLRLTAKSRGTCPAWHPGAGKPCWIFADEIEIQPR